ncbi:MAG: putative porin [Bacteroidales bacterium]|jgi:hypothetical protein|nr:putative porin [Bacteroidales bacterium]
MKTSLRYLIFILTLCLSNVCFGQFDFYSDTTDILLDSIDIEEDQSIVKREGGSANRGIVYYFYENSLNVGLPDLRFIDTTKSLFHRYDPLMRNNHFRSNRGNVGMVTEDLEYFYRDDLLFSYGKSPFELYRFTPFNTKFYQNVVPYVELFYVMGREREQNFHVLFTQNVWRGLNVGAEYNVINSPGIYNRTYTRHNSVRVFSNFISKDQHYRAVAGYYYNKFEANENGGILIPYDSLQRLSEFSNRKVIPIKLLWAENVWRENSFYLKQAYHFGINRNDTIPNSGLNFGYLSHALEITRFSTLYNDRMLDPANYPAIYRDSARTLDSTFVSVIRNTFSWNIGDVTSFQNSQFFNLSVGTIVDFAKVGTGDATRDTTKSDPTEYYKNYNRDYTYFYPFAKLRLNYQNQYFLTAGATYQMDAHKVQLGTSANVRLDYKFNETNPNDGFFAEVNYSDVLPRPFQEFYISNSYRWDQSLKNTQTLNFAVGAHWKGFYLRADHATFSNYIYLTPTHFQQENESFSVIKTSLEKTFKFYPLAFDTRLVFQFRPTGPLMQFPKFSTRNALYFDFALLQTTPIQIGVEAYYNTPYLSRFYNPALGSFYGQGDLETGGFVFLDVFLNLRVQRANLFLKFANVTADWLGYNYMMTNGYPVAERAFKFGVLWRFYD